ncbi:uncharacterized protein LOC126881805 [Diabrotica virgifera virgifera]|uniref:Uracil-DNA glycosylase-like domain-containing protein n=1 Tax=Diabrotica virgifera virgifera TaxID=50390 RepID=A0ABM5JWN2_DIAVI|nr:uncharacterized protein LOC126881805 [Diabrotica virgifera virgifera]
MANNNHKFEYFVKEYPILFEKSKVPEVWQDLMATVFNNQFDSLKNVALHLKEDQKWYPSSDKMWNFTNFCCPQCVKVIIVGQDPTSEPTGLAFSSRGKIYNSTINILKEVKDDIGIQNLRPEFQGDYGNLEYWAKQGVLLLNSTLTKRIGDDSHFKIGWKGITGELIKQLHFNNEKLVCMFWGQRAKDVINLCNVLTTGHPSRNPKKNFFGCKHFSQANKWLKDHGIAEIDWCPVPKTCPIPTTCVHLSGDSSELDNSRNYMANNNHKFEYFVKEYPILFEKSKVPEVWQDLMATVFNNQFDSLKNVALHLKEDQDWFPSSDKIWNFTKFCCPQCVKVIIVGQDPTSEATGVAFSSEGKIYNSTRNILKEVKSDIGEENLRKFKEDYGNLEYWARQGVLLLNSALTKHIGNNSHLKIGWKDITGELIKQLHVNNEKLVCMFWGQSAKNVINLCNVLTTGHPSRNPKKNFFGCKHFSQANKWLKDHDLDEIDWCPVKKSGPVPNTCAHLIVDSSEIENLVQNKLSKLSISE